MKLIKFINKFPLATLIGLLVGTTSDGLADTKTVQAANPATSEIEIINDYNDKLDVKINRDYQLSPGNIKRAPTISARIPNKEKSSPLDIGNVANSYFTLSVKSKEGKWHDFTCVLEFPNIAPYKTEVMCESDVGGDMYISASGHQIHVHYVTPNEDSPEDNKAETGKEKAAQ